MVSGTFLIRELVQVLHNSSLGMLRFGRQELPKKASLRKMIILEDNFFYCFEGLVNRWTRHMRLWNENTMLRRSRISTWTDAKVLT